MIRQTRRPKELTIRQVFLLLAILNGVVLVYLIYSAWAGILDPVTSEAHAYTTLYLAFLLLLGVSISYMIVQRRVISPLQQLVDASYTIACSVEEHPLLQVQGGDEVGRLGEAFNTLLTRQRDAIVRLDGLNRQLGAVNDSISNSIRYAAILQESILPEAELKEKLGSDHFILWHPRDSVGGDHYVFYEQQNSWLIGVADCAGHGVSGAMMTMLARADLDRVVHEVGIHSPAAILERTNAGMGSVLRQAQAGRALATSMDLGLVSVDPGAGLLRFSGAKIALYWSDGDQVGMIRGGGRSLWDRHRGPYADQEVPIDPRHTCYLVTDGLLDQAGGDHGFGLGMEQFRSWLRSHATLTLAQQRQAFSDLLRDFMGPHPQRDDITLLGFRIPGS